MTTVHGNSMHAKTLPKHEEAFGKPLTSNGRTCGRRETASSRQRPPRQGERDRWDGEALHAGGALDRTLSKRRDIGQERSGTKPRRRRRQPEKWQGPFEPDIPSGHLIWALAWSSATKHATVLVCLAISRARGVGQGVGTKRRQMGGMAKQTEGNALQKNPSLQETMLRYWRHAERSAP